MKFYAHTEFEKLEGTLISTPFPVTNCHTFLDPLQRWGVTYFIDGLKESKK